MPESGKIQSRLNALYQDLAPFEQIVLQLASILYEPVDTRIFLNCLRQAGIIPAAGDEIATAQLLSCLDKLKKLHLLDPQGRCHHGFVEPATRKALEDGRFHLLVQAVRKELPANLNTRGTPDEASCQRCLREIRIDIYSRDVERFNQDLLYFFQYQDNRRLKNPVVQVCNTPFEAGWFHTLPLEIRFYALHEILKHSLFHLEPITLPLAYLQEKATINSVPELHQPSFYYLLIAHLLLCGNIKAAGKSISQARGKTVSFGLSGWLQFLRGHNTGAMAHFAADLEQLRQANKSSNAYFTGVEGLFYILALLKSGKAGDLATIKEIIAAIHTIQPHNVYQAAYRLLQAVIAALENKINQARSRLATIDSHQAGSITTLFLGLCQYWIEGAIRAELLPALLSCLDRARRNGYSWLAMEYAELLHVATRKEKYRDYAETVRKENGIISLVRIVPIEEPWQRALKALNRTTSSAPPVAEGPPDRRLAWRIRHDQASGRIAIFPKEQKRTTKGQWSKGRMIALRRLAGPDRPAFLSRQDHLVCDALIPAGEGHGNDFVFEMERALPALVGHPCLFLDDSPSFPVKLARAEPELWVEKKSGCFLLRFQPAPPSQGILVVRQSRTMFKIVEPSEDHRRVAAIIGESGLEIPEDARDLLDATLKNISKVMTVHSTVGAALTGSRQEAPDSRIHLHLFPHGPGLRLSMLVKPLQRGGPWLKPAEGPRDLITEIDGQRIQVRRDFEVERENAAAARAFLDRIDQAGHAGHEWYIDDTDECLQLLVELRSLPDNVLLEWPEGKKLTVSPPAAMKQLYLDIRHRDNWFEINGSLRLDESLVLDMKQLLTLARSTSSRFIPLGEGQFLALTRQLRKRLDDLNAYAEIGKNGLRLPPLAAMAINDLADDEAHIQADRTWHQLRERVREAERIVPRIPSTLKAELRDYQAEGYAWLTRLAHWGVGACLADDMGLGKTIQALAVLLSRASQGPALVVAPTSVCLNWRDETLRFAPTLNPIIFGGKKRRKLLEGLRPFDLLITSYGLLQQEHKLLAGLSWQTIVLDEAQAIKNVMTKRSRAAMGLTGGFKLITTGTPIENHLGELWNLFQFINPGLLGTLDQFNKRFAAPIERRQDQNARRRLKKLIQPFILRRIKSQVLDELPPRTEITLKVEMGRQEAAFYEALRRNAVERLSRLTTSPGRKQFQILAEIMRLRRACCNPRLVLPDTPVPSAKLDLFGKVAHELLENRHKTLVFSQFVDHLSIIREFLDQHDIRYQYLDGSTPPRTRQKQVAAFQAGEGDFFLISLKAGGMGLNLTAADYVIHLDPWWNPAVEDQASDRAHRIGQEHPVTIYRLVVRDTIEEKIVRLHRKKRDLADSLLAGTDLGGRMTADDLLALLTEETF